MIFPFWLTIISSSPSFTEEGIATTFPVLLVVFILDHALAATRGQAIVLKRRALAVAILGDREQQTIFVHHLHAHQVVALRQIHRANAARRPAHRANLALCEANRNALARPQEHVVVAVRDLR